MSQGASDRPAPRHHNAAILQVERLEVARLVAVATDPGGSVLCGWQAVRPQVAAADRTDGGWWLKQVLAGCHQSHHHLIAKS